MLNSSQQQQPRHSCGCATPAIKAIVSSVVDDFGLAARQPEEALRRCWAAACREEEKQQGDKVDASAEERPPVDVASDVVDDHAGTPELTGDCDGEGELEDMLPDGDSRRLQVSRKVGDILHPWLTTPPLQQQPATAGAWTALAMATLLDRALQRVENQFGCLLERMNRLETSSAGQQQQGQQQEQQQLAQLRLMAEQLHGEQLRVQMKMFGCQLPHTMAPQILPAPARPKSGRETGVDNGGSSGASPSAAAELTRTSPGPQPTEQPLGLARAAQGVPDTDNEFDTIERRSDGEHGVGIACPLSEVDSIRSGIWALRDLDQTSTRPQPLPGLTSILLQFQPSPVVTSAINQVACLTPAAVSLSRLSNVELKGSGGGVLSRKRRLNALNECLRLVSLTDRDAYPSTDRVLMADTQQRGTSDGGGGAGDSFECIVRACELLRLQIRTQRVAVSTEADGRSGACEAPSSVGLMDGALPWLAVETASLLLARVLRRCALLIMRCILR